MLFAAGIGMDCNQLSEAAEGAGRVTLRWQAS